MKKIQPTITAKNKNVSLFKFGSVYYPKKDATESMIFEVTREDISKAIAHDPNACVLAQAIRRTYGDVHVTRTRAIVLKPIAGKIFAIRYTLGKYAQKGVASFDEGTGFAPGRYKLNPPAGTRKLDIKRKIEDVRKDRKSKNIRKRNSTVRHYLRLQTAAI